MMRGLLVGRSSSEEGCLTTDGDGEDVGMGVSVDGLHTSLFFFSNFSLWVFFECLQTLGHFKNFVLSLIFGANNRFR